MVLFPIAAKQLFGCGEGTGLGWSLGLVFIKKKILSAGARDGTQGVHAGGSEEDYLSPRRPSTLLSQGRRDTQRIPVGLDDWHLSQSDLIPDAGQHPLPVAAYVIDTMGISVTTLSGLYPADSSGLSICVSHCLLWVASDASLDLWDLFSAT